tara:strand:- start:2 stop:262 length:261 start_codon:yes stop_codon:yes gene_type:complete
MNKLFESIVTWVNIKFGKEQPMIPPFLMTYAANFIKDLVMDKAQSLAQPHIEKALENAPKELREALDKAVDEDSTHGHKSLLDMIK